MAAGNIVVNPLKDLRPKRTAWRIHVKILHAYKYYSASNGQTLELIFVDESGDKISASVKKEHIKKFESSLVLGTWKFVTPMTVNAVTGLYRVSNLKFRITFQHNTVVSPSQYNNDSLFLSFANYDAILAGSVDTTILFDVIGQVVDCGEVRDITTYNKPNKKLDFSLRDIEDNRVPCTLWGKFADRVYEANQQSADGMVICLIRFAKLNVYNDIRSVQNAFDTSQLLINTDLPEIVELRRVLTDSCAMVTVSDLGQKRFHVPPKIDPCLQYPRHNIAELLSETEVGKCRTICTVLSYDTDWPWYYISCTKCKKRVIVEESIKIEDVKKPLQPKFWCNVCNKYTKSVVAKLWFHLNIGDQSGHTKCMLFDSFASELLGGTTALQLLDGNYNELEDSEVLPEALTSICGKTFQFLLCHEKDNITNGYGIYTVAKVWLTDKLPQLLMIEEDGEGVDPYPINSGDQGSLMITNGESRSETGFFDPATPISSKRKSDETVDREEQSSTSKKPCSLLIVSDNESDQGGMIKKLDQSDTNN